MGVYGVISTVGVEGYGRIVVNVCHSCGLTGNTVA